MSTSDLRRGCQRHDQQVGGLLSMLAVARDIIRRKHLVSDSDHSLCLHTSSTKLKAYPER